MAIIIRRRAKVAGAISLCALMFASPVSAAESKTAAALLVNEYGVRHVPAFDLPPSDFLTPEARAIEIKQGGAPIGSAKKCSALKWWLDFDPRIVDKYRACLDPERAKLLARQRDHFDVTIEPLAVEGGTAYNYYDVLPAGGVDRKNRKRVLIHVPGSGSIVYTHNAARFGAAPIAAVGKVRVVGVDYRKGYEYEYPAALEDVTAVYKELLKTYEPENIGIYGCSAGGEIAGDMVHWLDKKGLPLPGALGISGEVFVRAASYGDSSHIANAMLGAPLESYRSNDTKITATDYSNSDLPDFFANHPYWKSVSPDDPAFSISAETMKKFPPTLLYDGGRNFAVSRIIYMHSQLVKHGVEADLHLWEGLGHCFHVNPDYPESHEVYNVITKFFDKHLGR